MIAFDILDLVFKFALFIICVINSLKWFNVALTEKIKLYAFDRYYGLFLSAIFGYSGSCFLLDFSKEITSVILYFAE